MDSLTVPVAARAVQTVVYEDRPDQLVGVKLLIASAGRHAPGINVAVVAPGAPEAFRQWISRRTNAELVEVPTGAATGWDVKPAVLLAMLRRGHREITWLDTDVLVARDPMEALTRHPGALLTTEDFWYVRVHLAGARTRAWGLEPGRVLPHPVNTAVLRVGSVHEPLLEQWRHMTRDPRYVDAQRQPHAARPAHLVGDQDLLDALLGSATWRHLDMELLRRGIDIAQCFQSAGFSPSERLRVRLGRGLPTFVHAMGAKPWVAPVTGRRPADGGLSTYAALAAGYTDEVDEDLSWTVPTGRAAALATRAVRGDPVLRQLVPAIAQAAVWRTRQLAGSVRHRMADGRLGGPPGVG